jgi:hypothetical protein
MEQLKSIPDYTWSYSSISLFQQCPRKFHRMRVAKDIVEAPQAHLDYGKTVHKVAEDYVRDGTVIPPQYNYIKPQVDMLKDMAGEKLCEHEMGLTKEFEPCKFRDKNVWFRGIADLLIINGEKATIIDWKTGKTSRYADKKQLELLSLLTFKHFPQVKSVKAGLVFLVAEDLVRAQFSADEQDTAWQKWIVEINQLEASYANDMWNPKPNFTCRNFCAVIDCEHNGSGYAVR